MSVSYLFFPPFSLFLPSFFASFSPFFFLPPLPSFPLLPSRTHTIISSFLTSTWNSGRSISGRDEIRGSEGNLGALYVNADSPCRLDESNFTSSTWSIAVPTISSLLFWIKFMYPIIIPPPHFLNSRFLFSFSLFRVSRSRFLFSVLLYTWVQSDSASAHLSYSSPRIYPSPPSATY